MRRFAAVVSLLCTACSVAEMKPLAADYDPRTIPRCDTDVMYAVGDTVGATLFAVLGTVIAINGHDAADGSSKWTGVGLTGAMALALAGSAAIGFRWSSACSDANAQWDRRQIEQDEHVRAVKRGNAPAEVTNTNNNPRDAAAFWCGGDQRCYADEGKCSGDCAPQEKAWCVLMEDDSFLCGRSEGVCRTMADVSRKRAAGECIKRRAERWNGPPVSAAVPPPVAAPPPAPPRGYFCSSSASAPGVGMCAREKADCERAREVALAAVGDLGACTLLEKAWCANDRCAPTQEACEGQRARAGIAAPCVETN